VTFPPKQTIHPTPTAASTADFAQAMSALASGVVLVTCWVGDRPWGMTVTAFASVSADPPTVLVSLSAGATSACAIMATKRFGVSILAADQLAVARHGSTPGATKFLDEHTDARAGYSESPVIAMALAHLDCEVTETVEVADHTVFFGQVRAVPELHLGTPLVYQRRGYRTLAEPVRHPHRPTERSLRCLSS
jgi:flavin reductase (DIM6/NTAB) family NADH-FMN oxidoreductase RutF